MDMVADKCNQCGKVVVKHGSADSSDMIQTNDSFLFMGDLLPGEGGRPSLALKEYFRLNEQSFHHYCLDCLVAVVVEWVQKLKQRPASNIPIGYVLPPGNQIIKCPICNK